MWSILLEIIRNITGIFFLRAKNPNIEANAFNKNKQKEIDKHNALIKEAHRTKNLAEIRKEASK